MLTTVDICSYQIKLRKTEEYRKKLLKNVGMETKITVIFSFFCVLQFVSVFNSYLQLYAR